MSYEKISGCRINPNKNILEFKSHSNNDDATPSWWPVSGETFVDKLVKCYYWWQDGSWQTGSLNGGLFKLKYAFKKFEKEMLKEVGDRPVYEPQNETYHELLEKDQKWYEKYKEWVINNKQKLLDYFNEKDSKKEYKIYYGTCEVVSLSSYGRLRYTWGSGKLFTLHQCEFIVEIRSELNLTYEKVI